MRKDSLNNQCGRRKGCGIVLQTTSSLFQLKLIDTVKANNKFKYYTRAFVVKSSFWNACNAAAAVVCGCWCGLSVCGED